MGRLGGGVLIFKKSERDLRGHMCGDKLRLESLHLLVCLCSCRTTDLPFCRAAIKVL